MRILIDECVDERFRNALPGHDCQTARYAGLAGLKNGELLTAAETAGFEVFLTVDQGIEYQQNLIPRKLAIIILRAKSNRLKDLLPLASSDRGAATRAKWHHISLITKETLALPSRSIRARKAAASAGVKS